MDIIILPGSRPNCSICGKPLESWNPLIEDEECTPCVAERISNELIKIVDQQLKHEICG